jgi:hypothetical protein
MRDVQAKLQRTGAERANIGIGHGKPELAEH